MRVHRFIVDFTVENSVAIVTDLEVLHQWKRVLKLKKGEEIVLVTPARLEVRTRLLSLEDTEARCEIISAKTNEPKNGQEVWLYCAVLKKENMEWVAQKTTEVGVDHIVPIITERTIKLGLRLDRLEKIVKEASEQSGRSSVPIVHDIQNFDDCVRASHSQKYFFQIGAPKFAQNKTKQSTAIYIGPEGGWTEREVGLAREFGCQIVGLGPLTLRGETAAIIASYLVAQI